MASVNEGQLHVINGTVFHVAKDGEGAPLVLLHGGYSNLAVWDRHVEAFAKEFRVLRYDQRGYGKTEVAKAPFSYYQDLKDVMDHFGIQKASLVGSSFGGSAVIDFALAYPERVDKIVLVAPSVNGVRYPLRLTWQGIKDFMRVRKHGIHRAAELFMDNAFWQYTIPQDEAGRRKFKELYVANEAFYQEKPSFHRPLTPRAIGRLSEIKHPVLIVEAGRDLAFNQKISRQAHRSIKGSKLVRMEHCGHYPHLESPVEFMDIIFSFMRLSDGPLDSDATRVT